MASLTALITFILFIFGIAIKGKTLLSISDLEHLFLTNENKFKVYYLNLIYLSILVTFLLLDVYLIYRKNFTTQTFKNINWDFFVSYGIILFICILLTIGPILKRIGNFLKFHYMYKVSIEGIGDLYIHKMMNDQICICTKDPNDNINMANSMTYLIKIEDLIQKPLIKEKILKPQSPLWKKFIF